ncbi:hypothetical protein EYC59_05800 [Candidatus Saccharibacteria bacterium]|nr:MAG: hypothetical protein EYC59_05800 [Candidatus Saccharibacteria bacterium]
MGSIRNFEEAKVRLQAFVPPAGSLHRNYQLDRMRKLMDLLGNPQDTYKVVHVAGTSGKTSTSYYVAALLGSAGKKVGLTVSPHVSEINERVQVDLVPLSEKEYCQELSEFLRLIEPFPIRPTYFELLVAFAYWEFARQKVEYAVVEVGLGGLLDGTNVVQRRDKVCVITDIGLDHVNVLGSDLVSIAAQKAGIILRENDVFVHVQPEEVMQVFRNVVDDKDAKLHVVTEDKIAGSDLPPFQQRNWTLAKAAFDFVAERDGLPALHTSTEGETQHTVVPGRMETVRIGDKTVILDGAHNAQKLGALSVALREQFGEEPVAALVGMMDDKEEYLKAALAELDSIHSLIATKINLGQDVPRQALSPETIRVLAQEAGIQHTEIVAEPTEALQRLLKRPERVLLITGSLYLVSMLRAKLQ